MCIHIIYHISFFFFLLQVYCDSVLGYRPSTEQLPTHIYILSLFELLNLGSQACSYSFSLEK